MDASGETPSHVEPAYCALPRLFNKVLHHTVLDQVLVAAAAAAAAARKRIRGSSFGVLKGWNYV
jgi:hypothetical protein